MDDGDPRRIHVLLELAAAHERTGGADLARLCLREAVQISRRTDDASALARAALSMQSLGHRTGAQNAEVRDLLDDAAHRLEITGGSLSLQSRVLAALTRVELHGSYTRTDAELIAPAHRAIALATTAGDASALAAAQLALHDAMWAPGTAPVRLPVIAEMLEAAHAAGDADLVAQAHLLRAAALIELGDPTGRDELLTYVTLAGNLGHARGRWGALTRQATYAQVAGRAEEAARLGEEALKLGQAIGEPDAVGCFYTSRWSLVALGVPASDATLDGADPLWPMLPMLRAWPRVASGDLAGAREVLGDFSVRDIGVFTGLEALAAAAVVFSAIGSPDQRRWTYERLSPHAGTHVVVGGAASYHAAVDHHLGTLAVSLGDLPAAQAHLSAALTMHERLGAPAWARLSTQALSDLEATTTTDNEFRKVDGRWLITFAGRHVQLPDAKGLHDLWTILGTHGAPVHVRTLLDPLAGDHLPTPGADPVLDDRAKAEYRTRLHELDRRIDDADTLGHSERAGRLRDERDALFHELAAATGLGGRPRPLGDESERARKTVSARLRDTLTKIDRSHPELGAHLRGAIRMGVTCSYDPPEPTAWRLA
jgi:hypothetical protein